MTHDELLASINNFTVVDGIFMKDALRAVLELHKPIEGKCNACEQWTNEGAYQLPYPCPTIQAIEKELK